MSIVQISSSLTEVAQPVIPKFSYSQLMTFDRCHFSWYLNYVEEWAPAETKSYFIEGNLVHELLMIYYKNLPLMDHYAALKLVKQKIHQWHAQVSNDMAKLGYVTLAARVVKRYIEDFSVHEDEKWEFLDAEKHFEIPLTTPKGRDFILEGYIDILAREKATNRVWIWDHKTVGQGKFWSEAELLMDSQMPTYVAALQETGIPIFGVIVNQLNKHEYKKLQDDVPEKLFKRKPIYHTAEELVTRLQEFGKIVDEALECKGTGDFRRSLKKDCSGCFFQDPCLMSLKEPTVPVGNFLQSEFVKKAPKRALI